MTTKWATGKPGAQPTGPEARHTVRIENDDDLRHWRVRLASEENGVLANSGAYRLFKKVDLEELLQQIEESGKYPTD